MEDFPFELGHDFTIEQLSEIDPDPALYRNYESVFRSLPWNQPIQGDTIANTVLHQESFVTAISVEDEYHQSLCNSGTQESPPSSPPHRSAGLLPSNKSIKARDPAEPKLTSALAPRVLKRVYVEREPYPTPLPTPPRPLKWAQPKSCAFREDQEESGSQPVLPLVADQAAKGGPTSRVGEDPIESRVPKSTAIQTTELLFKDANIPEGEVPCVCFEHKGSIVCDEIFGLDCLPLFELLFAEAGSNVMREAHRRRLTLELNVLDWDTDTLGRWKRRKVTYKYGFKAMIVGQISTPCFEEQEVTHYSRYAVSVDCKSSTPFVPYGGSFFIGNQYCLTQAGPGHARMRVFCRVEFTRLLLLKEKISSTSIEGVSLYFKELVDTMRSAVLARKIDCQLPPPVPETLPELIRDGRRPSGPRAFPEFTLTCKRGAPHAESSALSVQPSRLNAVAGKANVAISHRYPDVALSAVDEGAAKHTELHSAADSVRPNVETTRHPPLPVAPPRRQTRRGARVLECLNALDPEKAVDTEAILKDLRFAAPINRKSRTPSRSRVRNSQKKPPLNFNERIAHQKGKTDNSFEHPQLSGRAVKELPRQVEFTLSMPGRWTRRQIGDEDYFEDPSRARWNETIELEWLGWSGFLALHIFLLLTIAFPSIIITLLRESLSVSMFASEWASANGQSMVNWLWNSSSTLMRSSVDALCSHLSVALGQSSHAEAERVSATLAVTRQVLPPYHPCTTDRLVNLLWNFFFA
ncbi:hypothetical protein DFJ73DRAFT_821086 [Zopfochytrium polystomum]|nr:hypothetical protein DFJ73DRAFT_821086 [Zopfochytrium polystomum]